jgi:hypothetical protein
MVDVVEMAVFVVAGEAMSAWSCAHAAPPIPGEF